MVINIPSGKETEIKNNLDGEFKKFMDETEEPRAISKDKIGQFIVVGKLKKTGKWAVQSIMKKRKSS